MQHHSRHTPPPLFAPSVPPPLSFLPFALLPVWACRFYRAGIAFIHMGCRDGGVRRKRKQGDRRHREYRNLDGGTAIMRQNARARRRLGAWRRASEGGRASSDLLACRGGRQGVDIYYSTYRSCSCGCCHAAKRWREEKKAYAISWSLLQLMAYYRLLATRA